jgi:hypothetical protein
MDRAVASAIFIPLGGPRAHHTTPVGITKLRFVRSFTVVTWMECSTRFAYRSFKH